jgi:quercetin dioxygenase-like cupin family protein
MTTTAQIPPMSGAQPLVVLDADAVGRLPWAAMHGVDLAVTRVLWAESGSLAGVMRLDAGAGLAPHAHQEGHHHMWVLDGSARIGGRRVSAGSYVHVPAGVRHGVEDVGAGGFTMFYVYQRA